MSLQVPCGCQEASSLTATQGKKDTTSPAPFRQALEEANKTKVLPYAGEALRRLLDGAWPLQGQDN